VFHVGQNENPSKFLKFNARDLAGAAPRLRDWLIELAAA